MKWFFLLALNFLHASNIGQLFIIPVCPTHGDEHLEQVHKLVREKQIGGVIFMAGDSETQKALCKSLQAQVDYPLLTFQDVEWGVGMRLRDIPSMPKAMTLGAIDDLDLLRAFGRQLARECRLNGIQGGFTPVCDVNTNPKNPVIGMRAFGDDVEEVSTRALAVYEGMREGGLAASAKHFPGHGDTAVDSHRDLPVIDHLELQPFQTLIDAGIEMVMLGHLLFPEVSDDPSSLSYEIITKLLREQMGFEGVVISDALNMAALVKHYTMNEIVEKSLTAGTDLLLFATAQPLVSRYLIEKAIPEAIEFLEETYSPDAKKIERVNAMRYRQLPSIPEEEPGLVRKLYRSAVTKVGDFENFGDEIALVREGNDPTFEHFLARYAEVTVYSFSEMPENEPIVIELKKGDVLEKIPEHAVIALFDSPYALVHPRALVGYENVPFAKEAIADALFGKLTPSGKLPIQVSGGLGGDNGRESSRREKKI